MTLGGEDKWIKKSEFVAQTQFFMRCFYKIY